MAEHISDLKTCGLPIVTKDQFYRQYLQGGDLIFCCGQQPISKTIERLSGSPFSHVLMAHLPYPMGPWLTLEAEFERGVHMGLLSDYTDGQDGPLVLARRPAVSYAQRVTIIETMAALVDDGYDWQQEVTTVCHRLLPCLPVMHPAKELFCSGLQYVGAMKAAPFAYQVDAQHPNYPAPEDLYTDPSVVGVCILMPQS